LSTSFDELAEGVDRLASVLAAGVDPVDPQRVT
jgi:hypothetical protein